LPTFGRDPPIYKKRICNSKGHHYAPVARNIQRAIDDAGADEAVWLPKMDVTLTSIILPLSGQRIFGVGNGTILRNGCGVNDAIFRDYLVSDVELAWLHLIGSPTTGDGIDIHRSARCRVHDCLIEGTGEEGVEMLGATRCFVNDNYITNWGTKNISYAIDVADRVEDSTSYPSNDNVLFNNKIYSGTGIGIGFRTGVRNRSMLNTISIPSTWGIEFIQYTGKLCQYNSSIHDIILQPTQFAVCIQGGASYNRVADITLTGTDVANSVGIYILEASLYTIISNPRIIDFDHGIYILNSNHTIINGGHIRSCVTRGVSEAGTSDYTLLDSINLNGNGAAHDVNAANSIVGDVRT